MLNENSQSSTGTNNNILDKEIESWKGYEYALREEDAILFNKMLGEIREYGKAAASKGKVYPAEPLLMVLIFRQHKMIN